MPAPSRRFIVQVNLRSADQTEESRQTIFIPESEAELRRVIEEAVEGCRVVLHPNQRKIAYRDDNGLVVDSYTTPHGNQYVGLLQVGVV